MTNNPPPDRGIDTAPKLGLGLSLVGLVAVIASLVFLTGVLIL